MSAGGGEFVVGRDKETFLGPFVARKAFPIVVNAMSPEGGCESFNPEVSSILIPRFDLPQ